MPLLQAFMGRLRARMSGWQVLLSGLNLLGPALFVGGVLAWVGPRLAPAGPKKLSWRLQATLNFGAGSAALLLGLVLWGRDGKMLSYLGMVVACATSQWWCSRPR